MRGLLIALIGVALTAAVAHARRARPPGPAIEGRWQLTLTPVFSSCPAVTVGDVRTLVLAVERRRASYSASAESTQDPRDLRDYSGRPRGAGGDVELTAADGAILRLRKRVGSVVGVLLEPRRGALPGTGCAVVYNVRGAPPAAVGSAAGAPPTIGVKACDDYLAAVWRCTDKQPASMRDSMRDALGQVADMWRQMTGSQRAALSGICEQVHQASRDVYQDLGCQL